MSTTIGPFALATTHLVFILSFLIALTLAWWLGRNHKNNIADAVFRIIAVGLITARLVFVIRYYDIYLTSPWQILNVRDGGFMLSAGIIGGLLWLFWELRRAPMAKKAISGSLAGGLLVAVAGYSWLTFGVAQTDFPDANLTNLNNQPVNLVQQYQGQPVVLNLWASWCPPCVREMPLLENAVDAWPEVAFVTINQGESAQQVRSFLNEQGLNLPHVLLDAQSQIGQQTGSSALPTTLFFNSDGSIGYVHIGEFSAATLENALRRLD